MSETTLLRLNRAIAQSGLCSRRKADELIQSGRVRVNGCVADTPGLRVNPLSDHLEIDGTPISLLREEQLTLLLHKPPKVMTTFDDPQGRPTVLSLLPPEVRAQRPVPVGRLDFMSEGLLLMSTDGELTHRLTHPRYHLPKIYHVSIYGRVHDRSLDIMRKGMLLADGTSLAPVQVRVLEQSRKNTLLELRLVQGVNRQIRRMCADFKYKINFLRRVAQGPLCLGDLPQGRWRILNASELTALRRSVGLL